MRFGRSRVGNTENNFGNHMNEKEVECDIRKRAVNLELRDLVALLGTLLARNSHAVSLRLSILYVKLSH